MRSDAGRVNFFGSLGVIVVFVIIGVGNSLVDVMRIIVGIFQPIALETGHRVDWNQFAIVAFAAVLICIAMITIYDWMLGRWEDRD